MFDKNGIKIKIGDTIVHDNGDREEVVGYGDIIGIVADKEGALVYPLTEFNLSEWTVERGEKKEV